jgi:hypothetical protein
MPSYQSSADEACGTPKGHRRRPAQRLFDHRADIWERGEVGEGRWTSEAYDFVEFGVGPDLDLGVSEHGEEPPVERSRRCLSTRSTTVCETLDPRGVLEIRVRGRTPCYRQARPARVQRGGIYPDSLSM